MHSLDRALNACCRAWEKNRYDISQLMHLPRVMLDTWYSLNLYSIRTHRGKKCICESRAFNRNLIKLIFNLSIKWYDKKIYVYLHSVSHKFVTEILITYSWPENKTKMLIPKWRGYNSFFKLVAVKINHRYFVRSGTIYYTSGCSYAYVHPLWDWSDYVYNNWNALLTIFKYRK